MSFQSFYLQDGVDETGFKRREVNSCYLIRSLSKVTTDWAQTGTDRTDRQKPSSGIFFFQYKAVFVMNREYINILSF